MLTYSDSNKTELTVLPVHPDHLKSGFTKQSVSQILLDTNNLLDSKATLLH